MRCELNLSILSMNVRGGFKGEKVEELKQHMTKHRFFAATIQETWVAGTSICDNDQFLILGRGVDVDSQKGKKGHPSGGVAIVLCPEAVEAWKKAGSQVLYFGDRIIAVSLVVCDEKLKLVKLFLVSAYSPIGAADKAIRVQYYADLEKCFRACKHDQVFVMGTDANASMGTQSSLRDKVLGQFGEARVNDAGLDFHSFCGRLSLCAPSTFFRKKSYSSWFHPCSGLGHQIDHFIVRRQDFKMVRDTGLFGEAALDSDHRPLRLTLNIARNLSKQHASGRSKFLNRALLKKPDVCDMFCQAVVSNVQTMQGGGTKFSRLTSAMDTSAKGVLIELQVKQPGWFAMRLPVLMEKIKERNTATELLGLASKSRDARAIEEARSVLRSARSRCKQEVSSAKVAWIEERVRAMRGGSASPGEIWTAVKELAAGMDKSKPVLASLFRKPDGIMSTPEENSNTVQKHFTSVYDAKTNMDRTVLDEIKQRPVRIEFDVVPSDEEIHVAIRRAKDNKACGDSKIPAEFWKALASREDSFALVRDNIHDIWYKGSPEECQIGRLKILPKKGDLHDLNNWRGIMLLESMAKLMSIILDTRLQQVVDTEGQEGQNGFRPARGTIDGIFSLKIALQKRKEHGLSSWAVFIDLVKAFDTVPRDALFIVLQKYGMPERFIKVVMSLYQDFTVKLAVGEAGDVEVPSTVGVLQGSNLSPVLFIIFIQAVMEVAQAKLSLSKPVFRTKMDGVTHGRRYNTGGALSRGTGVTEFVMGDSFYADDGAFIFLTRADCEATMNILYTQFLRFGMKIHIGRNGGKSKTEALYVPHARETYEDADTSDLVVDGGSISFTKCFKYLGSSVNSSLNDDEEILLRIKAAVGAFARLRKMVFESKKVPYQCKKMVYEGIVLSILLYGCEAWVLSEKSVGRLRSFHRKATRQMCRVTTAHTWLHRVTSEALEDRVGLRSIECYVSQRRLQWIGSVMRMKVDRLPRQLVSSWVNHRRPLGRPLLNYGQSLDKDLRRVGFGAGENWSEIAQDKNRWTKKIKVGLVSARLADIQKKQLDSVARERAMQGARAAAVHLEARRLARVQQVAGP